MSTEETTGAEEPTDPWQAALKPLVVSVSMMIILGISLALFASAIDRFGFRQANTWGLAGYFSVIVSVALFRLLRSTNRTRFDLTDLLGVTTLIAVYCAALNLLAQAELPAFNELFVPGYFGLILANASGRIASGYLRVPPNWQVVHKDDPLFTIVPTWNWRSHVAVGLFVYALVAAIYGYDREPVSTLWLPFLIGCALGWHYRVFKWNAATIYQESADLGGFAFRRPRRELELVRSAGVTRLVVRDDEHPDPRWPWAWPIVPEAEEEEARQALYTPPTSSSRQSTNHG